MKYPKLCARVPQPPCTWKSIAATICCLMSTLPGAPVHATNHIVRINEVMAGLNGDSTVQFVEMVAGGDGQKDWGAPCPFGQAQNAGCAMLLFFDAAGNQTGRFVVPNDPSSAADTVLFATQALADLTGITPDFIIPPLVMPNAGKVCFTTNPDAVGFIVNLCLSYGGAAFTGSTEGAGAANPASLSILGSQSLSRNTSFSSGSGTNDNSDFVLATPTPSSTQNPHPNLNEEIDENEAGEAVLPTAASLVVQGDNLFNKEAFLGNGRTCATCHVGSEALGLPPSFVSLLPPDDLLFLETVNVNTLVLNSAGSVHPSAATQTTQPSDFFVGDTITGSLGGSARVLAGSGNTYLIHGGSDLNASGNVISDSLGNSGTLVSFTEGDLDGPAPTGDSAGLEDPVLINGGRALIVENINGFDQFSFRRASPNLLNIKHTAPYGLSAEFPDLQTFSAGAVAQHFPRRLARVVGTDFREATAAELAAMEAFMDSTFLPADQNFDEANNFDRFVTTEAQKRGRSLFFGLAKCNVCHSGTVLATSDGTFGTTAGVNESFNTGVADLPINTTDGLPTEQDIGQPANSREFSTRPLFGVKNTAPFFHDSSVPTLVEAIQFYDTIQFRDSPAFAQVGALDIVSLGQSAQDIAAFLNGLVDLNFTFTGSLAFGTRSVSAGASSPMTVTVVNTGSAPLTITAITLNGIDLGEFAQAGASPDAGPFGNGVSRTIDVTFDPSSAGAKAATLELRISDGLESWDVGVALSGTGLMAGDPDISVDHSQRAFGDQPTTAGASMAQTVLITNGGVVPLTIASVSLASTNAADFTITGDTGESSLAPAANRTVMVAFDPNSTGTKVADLRIVSNDPDQGTLNVALTGIGKTPGNCAPPNLSLSDETVAGQVRFEACTSISAQDVSVAPSGDLTLRAGQQIVLMPGFKVANNASFRAEIDPSLELGADLTMLTISGTCNGNGTIAVSGSLQNIGSAATGAFEVGIYVSTNSAISNADTRIAFVTFASGLAAGAVGNFSGDVTLPSLTPGSFFIGAIADDLFEVSEDNEANNTLAGNQEDLPCGSGIDLVPLTISASCNGDGTLAISGSVQNVGTVAAAPFEVGLYVSTNSTISTGDTRIAFVDFTAGLTAGSVGTFSGNVTLPSLTPGTFFIGAIADDLFEVGETNEANNTLAGNQEDLPCVTGIDLVTLTIAGTCNPDGTLAVSGSVQNIGAEASTTFDVGVYVSTNSTISTGDTRIAFSEFTGGLGAGATGTFSGDVALPSLTPGTFFVGAFADDLFEVSETNEANNTLAGNQEGLPCAVAAVAGNPSKIGTGAVALSTSVLTRRREPTATSESSPRISPVVSTEVPQSQLRPTIQDR